jgi:CheY-like chemotaxis protein
VNQKVALSQLSRLGCDVEVANNGLEAVQAITQNAYDLVFMDCQMPDMDGYQATREIRLIPGDRARTPIVAMTANAMQGDEQKCLDAGMDGYISKPVKLEVLRGMIQEYAVGHESEFAPAKAAERLVETKKAWRCPLNFPGLARDWLREVGLQCVSDFRFGFLSRAFVNPLLFCVPVSPFFVQLPTVFSGFRLMVAWPAVVYKPLSLAFLLQR